MKAILLADRRLDGLRPLTDVRPAGLVEFDGRSIIDHQRWTLATRGYREIGVVTGHFADQILADDHMTEFYNASYAEAGSVVSLTAAKDWLDGKSDVIIGPANILFEPRLLQNLVACREDIAVSVDTDWAPLWKTRTQNEPRSGRFFRLTGDDIRGVADVTASNESAQSDASIAQFTGLVRLAGPVCRELVDWESSLPPDWTYRGKTRDSIGIFDLIAHWCDEGRRIEAARTRRGWLEFESIEDLTQYQSLDAKGMLPEYWSTDTQREVDLQS